MRALKIINSITRRDEKSLDKYLTEISKYEVLTPEEEALLFKKIRNGDEKAFRKVLMHNLRFTVSVAKQYQRSGLWLGDLINEGNIGLIKAAKRFDETKGFKFISYAVWWVRQSILDALSKTGRKIRLPSNHLSVSKNIIQAKNDYLQKHEWEPNSCELSNITGYPEKTVKKCLETYKKCKSLDAPVINDNYTSLANLIEDQKVKKPDHSLVKEESQKQDVKRMLNELPPKEAKVISLYFGIERKFPMNLSDIGQQIGVSKNRARQLKDRGLNRLRISSKYIH